MSHVALNLNNQFMLLLAAQFFMPSIWSLCIHSICIEVVIQSSFCLGTIAVTVVGIRMKLRLSMVHMYDRIVHCIAHLFAFLGIVGGKPNTSFW
jgi:hypothetical protein